MDKGEVGVNVAGVKLNKKIRVIAVALILVAIGFAGLITPGYILYNYKNITLGGMGKQEIRINRFTDKAQIYGAGKWQPIVIRGGNVHFPEGTEILVK